jgi:hypothetical protein
LVVNHKEGGVIYYRCGYAIEYKEYGCGASQIASPILEDFVKDWVLANAGDDRAAVDAMRNAAKRREMQSAIDSYRMAKKTAEERLTSLQEKYTLGDLTRDFFLNKKADLEGEIAALDNQIKEAGGVMTMQIPSAEDFRGLLETWDEMEPDELNTALKSIIAYGLMRGGGRRSKNKAPYDLEIKGRWEATPINFRIQKREPVNSEAISDTPPGR